MRCEACGYQFLLASSTKCPDCGDLREAIVPELKRLGDSPPSKDECKTEDSPYAQQRSQNAQNFIDGVTQAAAQQYAATNILRNSSIMDSTVGLKAANAHLTRQLAAQALAHAEQLEGLKTSRDTAIAGLQRAVIFAEKLQGDYQELERFSRARIVMHQSSCDEYDEMLAAKDARIAELDSELSAMRVTPATQPTDVQQTAGDGGTVVIERRPDGTLKPFARAWEAPKRTTDVRRLGG